MTSKDNSHIKHGSITKPSFGEWGRSEFAIYGTTCNQVSEIFLDLRKLFPDQSIAYLDAHHDDHNPIKIPEIATQCTLHASHGELVSSKFNNNYLLKSAFADNNLIVVNGNHFQACHQFIVCNPDKEKSLRKRIAELSDIKLILLPQSIDQVPDYVIEILGDRLDQIPVINLKDKASIKDFITNNYLIPPKLNALILAGGRSTRMGMEKSQINYHGFDQIHHLKNITESLGLETFISCRADQVSSLDIPEKNILVDRMNDMGPLGGIISAFMFAPDSAWLVIACDLPFLDKSGIEFLIQNRKSEFQATAFRSDNDNFPEPLAAIWEPTAYSSILNFLTLGYSCPRKVLINTKTNLLGMPDSKLLTNVNSPDELQSAKQILNAQRQESTKNN